MRAYRARLSIGKLAGIVIICGLVACGDTRDSRAGTVEENNGANAICGQSPDAIKAFIREMGWLKKQMVHRQDAQTVSNMAEEAKYCLKNKNSAAAYLRNEDKAVLGGDE